MDADEPLWRQTAHRIGDRRADVAALGHVARVAEAVHQLRPGLCHAAGPPAELGRLGGKPVPGHGGQHEVERVLGGSAVSRRIGERADGLEQLDHRARPAVGHDQRQRVLVLRLDVDEVDLDPVDLGRELGKSVELRLGLAPVVVGLPVAGELLQGFQLHALGAIVDELLRRPARRGDAAPQVGELLVRNVDLEGLDVGLNGAHEALPSLRSVLNAARISVAKISGSSQAAKCPPFSASL